MPQLREELEGGVVMHKIKFSRCPIGRHKGERWEKLAKVDTSKPVVLYRVEYLWSSVFWGVCGREDTFCDFSSEDWVKLLEKFYNTDEVFGIVLYFRQDGKSISTFRAYDVRKAAYYERCVGEEFMVEEVE